MIFLDIVEPIQKPTKWVNGLAVVEKPNGKLWVCLDLRPLNKANVNTSTSPMMKKSPKFLGAAYFLKLDTSSHYWQIKVDEQSSNLLAIGTFSCRHHFKWLPYGIQSLSEVFQRVNA